MRPLIVPAAVALALALPANLAGAAEIPIAPGEDWCGAINNMAAPGDEVVLAAGDHMGPCAINNGGAPDNPIVLRGPDPQTLANIVYNGNSSNVIDVQADHVTISSVHFGPTNAAIDAIKIKSGSHVTVEGCEFNAVGGISISANSMGVYESLTIRGNYFHDLQATGIYIGCHSGMGMCEAPNVLIEGNLIDGVDSANVGYGLEIKLDSYGIVRDNVIHDTKGPGIEIYGSSDLNRGTIVEGNLVVGSRNNGTLEIGGGPALVQNNIVVGGSYAGIYVYDYGFDVVHDIQVFRYTLRFAQFS